MTDRLIATGRLTCEIHRADGRVERRGPWYNLAPDVGTEHYAVLLNQEAGGSPMAYMAVGSTTGAASMTSTLMGGEMARKALSVKASSLNTLVWTATFGGAADTLTSLPINEVGAWNHANSGQGELGSHLSISNSTVTLAASDLVKFEITMTVGSHS